MRLGSDPEFFLVDSNGKHISAIGYINADKWNPYQIPELPNGYTLQEDNVALELGIPPANSGKQLFEHLSTCLEAARLRCAGLSFSGLSATVFEPDQMSDPRANIFGCEPDYNAWGPEGVDEDGNPLNVNPSPVPSHPFLRSCGGHIHVETTEAPAAVVRSMDLFLGVPSVLMDNGELRKKLYGKRGAHRVKPYGVEYRVLSNFWTTSEKLCTWVWEQTERALKNLGAAEYYDRQIELAINSNNKIVAEELVYELGLEVV